MSMILDGSNGVTFNDASLQGAAASPYVLKNRIINGDMRIDQRNAGASVTPIDSSYGLDRWKWELSPASKITAQQNAGSVTPPSGFSNYLGITSSSAYTITSANFFDVYQNIEGFNTSDLMFGTASAKTITISAWVYSSLTGTFGGSLVNSAGNRSYVFSYTINTANTWQQISVTIAGDTTGTWIGATNGLGLAVHFSFGMGSNYTTTAGSWAAGLYLAPTGQTSVVGTNGATFYITGVQLEIGTSATPFERRLYGQELINCQRYFQVSDGCQGVGTTTTAFYAMLLYQVVMRASPTISQTAILQITDAVAADYTQSSTNIIINSGNRVSPVSVNFQAGNFTGLTTYRPYINKSGISGYVTLSAEL